MLDGIVSRRLHRGDGTSRRDFRRGSPVCGFAKGTPVDVLETDASGSYGPDDEEPQDELWWNPNKNQNHRCEGGPDSDTENRGLGVNPSLEVRNGVAGERGHLSSFEEARKGIVRRQYRLFGVRDAQRIRTHHVAGAGQSPPFPVPPGSLDGELPGSIATVPLYGLCGNLA